MPRGKSIRLLSQVRQMSCVGLPNLTWLLRAKRFQLAAEVKKSTAHEDGKGQHTLTVRDSTLGQYRTVQDSTLGQYRTRTWKIWQHDCTWNQRTGQHIGTVQETTKGRYSSTHWDSTGQHTGTVQDSTTVQDSARQHTKQYGAIMQEEKLAFKATSLSETFINY